MFSGWPGLADCESCPSLPPTILMIASNQNLGIIFQRVIIVLSWKTHLFRQTLAGHIMFQLTLLSILLLTDHLMEPIKIYHLKWDQLKSYEEAKNYLGRAE